MIRVRPVNPQWRFLIDRIESGVARNYASRYDQDSNGVVGKSEFRGTDEEFERVDRNRDSRLQLSEIKHYVDLLREHESVREFGTDNQTSGTEDRFFTVSPSAKLTESMRGYFSEELRHLDENGNGLLENDEFVGTMDEFSALDGDNNRLISSREWAEGFVKNQTEINTVIKAYRFSQNIFQGNGGTVRMTV